jgi:hypothetical protein
MTGRIVSELSMNSQWTHWVIDPLPPVEAAADKALTEVEGNEEDVEKWDELNGKALRSMILRLHHTLSHKYRTQSDAGLLWQALERDYSKPGLISTYLEFKAAMEIQIFNNSDPSLAIDKFASHFGRLAEAKVTIADHVQAMILMAKLLSSMDHITQIICQEDVITKLSLNKV